MRYKRIHFTNLTFWTFIKFKEYNQQPFLEFPKQAGKFDGCMNFIVLMCGLRLWNSRTIDIFSSRNPTKPISGFNSNCIEASKPILQFSMSISWCTRLPLKDFFLFHELKRDYFLLHPNGTYTWNQLHFCHKQVGVIQILRSAGAINNSAIFFSIHHNLCLFRTSNYSERT